MPPELSELPVLPDEPGEVTVRGRIAPPPAKLYDFDGAPDGTIRQNLDLAAYEKELGLLGQAKEELKKMVSA